MYCKDALIIIKAIAYLFNQWLKSKQIFINCLIVSVGLMLLPGQSCANDTAELLIYHCAADLPSVKLLYQECPNCEIQFYVLKPHSVARIKVLDMKKYHPLYAVHAGQKVARVGIKWGVFQVDHNYAHQFAWRGDGAIDDPETIITLHLIQYSREYGRDACLD
jgi:hypothetical protein